MQQLQAQVPRVSLQLKISQVMVLSPLEDEIFPPDRMRAYWGEKGTDFESYHFPFYNESIVMGEL